MAKSSFKNLPTSKAEKWDSLIEVVENQSVSMSLAKSDKMQIFLFSISQGEEIDEEFYFADMLYSVVAGSVELTMNGENVSIGQGEVMVVKEGVPHKIQALTDTKLLQATFIDN